MQKVEKAVFGAGCFWHVQFTFSNLKGVLKTTVGYMGGNEKRFPDPTYEEVCSDESGYAEVVQVEFNPKEVSYGELLDVFWKEHDPTTKNRQGSDYGSQYRSVVFYFNKEQKKKAEASRMKAQLKHQQPIVTEIKPAGAFFKAEDYHQDYLKKRGQMTC